MRPVPLPSVVREFWDLIGAGMPVRTCGRVSGTSPPTPCPRMRWRSVCRRADKGPGRSAAVLARAASKGGHGGELNAQILMGKENRPGLMALTCIFRWSCRESNPLQKSARPAEKPILTTRNNAKVREMTSRYARGVDGINSSQVLR